MRIKNWSQFQHFKDRSPPWIKLYRDILDDPDWYELNPKYAKFLVMLWLVASEDKAGKGNLPPPKKLAFRLRVEEKEIKNIYSNLSEWLDGDDIGAISERYRSDAPETETETETETDKKKNIKKKDVFIQPYLGEMENVKLTLVEFEKLQSRFSDYESKIDDLSCYIDSKGDKYKSHYSTILMWDRKNVKETKGKSGVLQPTTYAQAQDAERRGRAAWLKGEMGNDNLRDGGKGDRKAIPVLPSDKIQQ